MYLAPYLRVVRDHPKPLAFGALHSFFSSPGQTYAIAVLTPFIALSLDLSEASLGVIYTIVSLASAATIPYLGRLIDRVDLGRYSLVVGAGMATGCLATAFAPGAIALTLGLFLMRLTGQGLMTHIGATATGRYFGPSRGKALGVTSLGMPLGEAVFPLLLVVLVGLTDWRMTLAAVGELMLVAFLPLSRCLVGRKGVQSAREDPGRETADAGAGGITTLEIIRSRHFRHILPLAAASPFVLTGLIFHQGFIGEAKGWGIQYLASVFFLFAMGHATGAIAIGPIVDRLGAARLFPFNAIPFGLALAALWVGGPGWMGMIYLGLAGLAMGFYINLSTALWAEVYGTANLGAVRSLAATLMVFAAAAAPAIFGWALETGVPVDTILVLAIIYTALAALWADAAPGGPNHQRRPT